MRNLYFIFFAGIFFIACNGDKTPGHGPETVIVSTPEQMEQKLPELISESIKIAINNSGRLDDSIILSQPSVLAFLYEQKNYNAFWSKEENWTQTADSLLRFIENARLYGLFPEDYHF